MFQWTPVKMPQTAASATPGRVISTKRTIGYGTGLKVEPHQYIDDGHYLTIRSRDGRYGMSFETERGKITSFYGGRFEAVQYVEGCL